METFEFFQWHWWAAVAIILFIAEIMLPGFWVLCLGIGAVGGSAAAALGMGADMQLLTFSAFSLLAFFTIRPLLLKRLDKGPQLRTNADALHGQRGRVTQDFDPSLRLGRVAVGGDDWRAESLDDRSIRVGDIVEVLSVNSNTLIVKLVS